MFVGSTLSKRPAPYGFLSRIHSHSIGENLFCFGFHAVVENLEPDKGMRLLHYVHKPKQLLGGPGDTGVIPDEEWNRELGSFFFQPHGSTTELPTDPGGEAEQRSGLWNELAEIADPEKVPHHGDEGASEQLWTAQEGEERRREHKGGEESIWQEFCCILSTSQIHLSVS
jgi:hypothetical protein